MRVWVMYTRLGATESAFALFDSFVAALESPELATADQAVVVSAEGGDAQLGFLNRETFTVAGRSVLAQRVDGGVVITRAALALAARRLPPKVPSAAELM